MATSFLSLPVVDLSPLKSSPTARNLDDLGQELYDVFTTTGFAYLINCPLSFAHDEVLDLARDFFSLSMDQKMKIAKQSFNRENLNTYHGYFPPQPGKPDNLKEGLEIGPPDMINDPASVLNQKINLAEPNVWPSDTFFKSRQKIEQLHQELQSLSAQLLSLLAVSLGRPRDHFDHYLDGSLSTLRLLHYPPQATQGSEPDEQIPPDIKLCCTPHTDSGILTLLHQDPTGGLEVLNASGSWIPAPYIPGSIVVNIGDLMGRVSGGRFVATMHRVSASTSKHVSGDGMGRFSVPFFFEPGENCVVQSVDGGDDGVVYGEHVRAKMATWVEFQDLVEDVPGEVEVLPHLKPIQAF